MTDYQKQRLAKLVSDYYSLCAGDIDAMRCADVILPILRDAIFKARHRGIAMVDRTDANRLAREFVHAAGAFVATAYHPHFVPRMRSLTKKGFADDLSPES